MEVRLCEAVKTSEYQQLAWDINMGDSTQFKEGGYLYAVGYMGTMW